MAASLKQRLNLSGFPTALQYNTEHLYYSEHVWKALAPKIVPYSKHEKAIIEARKQFKWEVVGISENGDFQLRILNQSDLVLPHLTLGARARDGSLNGGIWVPVSIIEPGMEKVVEIDVYKDRRPAELMEVYDLGEPRPQDRVRFWEFREE